MDDTPSVTARRVAAHRLGAGRLATTYGDPAADDRLAADVAAGQVVDAGTPMGRYLRARTAFFDRVVVDAVDRGVGQVLVVGAGYDGRALRYGADDVAWFEVDHPATQTDKRRRLDRLGIATPSVTFVAADLRHPGLGAGLLAAGYDPDAHSLIYCEGVAVYLDEAVLLGLLVELRSLAGVGTRLALSLGGTPSPARAAARVRFEADVAAVSEPAVNDVRADDAGPLLALARWRRVDLPPAAGAAGFLVAAPRWEPPAGPMTVPSTGRLGAYLDATLGRRGVLGLAGHLAATYGLRVEHVGEVATGVFEVGHAGGSWAARVFPGTRPVVAVRGDAAVLAALAGAGFPAERPAAGEAVSVLADQAVLVTRWEPGGRSSPTPTTYGTLGRLVATLATLPATGALARPGGGWHHLTPEGTPADEIAAAAGLFDAAGHRVRRSDLPRYRELVAALGATVDCAGLPEAPVHADPVPANAVTDAAGAPCLVDWAGAGRGPRVWGLALVLWSAAVAGPAALDAAASAYADVLRPDGAELAALEDALAARATVVCVWGFATGRASLDEAAAELPAIASRAAAAARAARRILAGDRPAPG